jgi:hypothetical protein
MKGVTVKILLFSTGCLLVLAAGATPAYAMPIAVPEIDPGSLSSAMTFLAGVYCVLRSKLFRK